MLVAKMFTAKMLTVKIPDMAVVLDAYDQSAGHGYNRLPLIYLLWQPRK